MRRARTLRQFLEQVHSGSSGDKRKLGVTTVMLSSFVEIGLNSGFWNALRKKEQFVEHLLEHLEGVDVPCTLSFCVVVLWG